MATSGIRFYFYLLCVFCDVAAVVGVCWSCEASIDAAVVVVVVVGGISYNERRKTTHEKKHCTNMCGDVCNTILIIEFNTIRHALLLRAL